MGPCQEKRPSAHSDQQFAVFLDKIKNTLHADEGAKFEAALRKLILKDSGQDRQADPAVAPGRRITQSGLVSVAPAPGNLLRPRADFAAIEAAARDTATADRQNLMTLIGQLVLG